MRNVIKKDDIVIFTSFPNQKELINYNSIKVKEFLDFYNEILEISLKNNVAQFIFFSSIKVYADRLKINEFSTLKSIDNYSRLKIQCEKTIMRLKNSALTKFKIIRLSNVFGVNKNYNIYFDELLIPSLIRSAFFDKHITINLPYLFRDFITLGDFIKKFKLIINDNINKFYQIYNLGSYKSVNLNYVAKIIKYILKKKYNYDIKITLKSKKIYKLEFKSNHIFLKKSYNKLFFINQIEKLIIFYNKIYDAR